MKDCDHPTVAIGLCVRNCEKTISKTVRSIVDLEYPRDKFQLLVVDGHSTDNTVKVIRDMLINTSISTVFMTDKGQGLSYARQMVVDNCNSKYIVWIDGDNIVPRNFLQSQVEYMEEHPEMGFCGVGIVPLGKTVVSRLQGYQWVIPGADLKKHGYLMGKTGIQGTICRMDAINHINGFDLSIRGAGEDVDLFIRMRIAGWKIGYNHKTRIYHHMRDTWKDLWKESVWWGYGTHYLNSKHTPFFPSLRRRAGFAVIDCIKLTFKSLKLTKDFSCVLMPLHYGFRRLGFLVGHWHAQNDGYHFRN